MAEGTPGVPGKIATTHGIRGERSRHRAGGVRLSPGLCGPLVSVETTTFYCIQCWVLPSSNVRFCQVLKVKFVKSCVDSISSFF